MKLKRGKALIFLVVLALFVGILSGCASVELLSKYLSEYIFSATELVQGNMDITYLNQYTDEYLQSVDMTVAEADAYYEDGLAAEKEYFASYFNIYLDLCPDSVDQRITDLLDNIYSHSKYEVGEQTTSGDTYLVSVTIYPIDIIDCFYEDDWETLQEQLTEIDESGALEEMTEEEQETWWAESILDLLEARLDSIGYLDPETISVQVSPDEDGIYSISDNDFYRIDSLIIAY